MLEPQARFERSTSCRLKLSQSTDVLGLVCTQVQSSNHRAVAPAREAGARSGANVLAGLEESQARALQVMQHQH